MALLAVIFTLVVVAVLRYVQVDEIQLPDVRGMQYTEAVALLRQSDLVPISYADNVQGMAIEVVTNQTPPPGSVVREGRNVSIGVNRPPEASRAPVLLGLLSDQAINTSAAVNIQLRSIEYANSSQPPGRVIEQRPEPGERVAPGEGLSIVVSRGPATPALTMPDLLGVPVDRAREQLVQMGLRSVESIATGVSFEAPGSVASQAPVAGEAISASSPVLLSYNLSAGEVVPVPGVIGQHAELAERLLRAAGLGLGELHYVDNPDLPSGTVVETSPSAYTLRGMPVSLTLNAPSGAFDDLRRETAELELAIDEDDGELEGESGPTTLEAELDGLEDMGRRVSVTFDPAALGVRALLERDYDLRLLVEDDAGERTVIDRRVRAGETVSAVVLVEGDALLQTYINGVFFQAWRP